MNAKMSVFKRFLNIVNVLIVNIGILLVLFGVCELFSFTALQVTELFNPGGKLYHPPEYKLAIFKEHLSWFGQYDRDKKQQKFFYRIGLWEPYNVQTATINAQEGTRSSGIPNTSDNPGEHLKTVFCFGGSTMWGEGVKDQYTIPALLNRRDDHSKYQFLNYGIPAYVSTQEVLRLTLLLTQGKRPDVVLFYDGINDSFATFSEAPGFEQGYGRQRRTMARETPMLLLHLIKKTSMYKLLTFLRTRVFTGATEQTGEYVLTEDDEQRLDEAVRVYLNNIAHVKKLGEVYGFDTWFFLQPCLLTGYEYEAGVVTEQEQYLFTTSNPRLRKFVRVFYEKVRNEEMVRDLSEVFIRQNQSNNYYDTVHLGPEANEVVAQEIYNMLP